MKTAISIPDPLFNKAEEFARRCGMSRSELYVTALAAYLEEHQAEFVTDQLNQLYTAEDSSLDEIIQQLQSLSLFQEEW